MLNRTYFLRRGLLAITAISALSLGAVACGDDDDDGGAANEPSPTTTGGVPRLTTIQVGDNFFSPDNQSVPAGTNVTWTWSGEVPHSVVGTFNGTAVESDVNTGSGTFEFTFESAGTFDYQCGIHGASMSGTITVT